MGIDLFVILVLLSTTFIAVFTDLKTGLIYNRLTFPLFFGGLTFKFYLNGPLGIIDAIAAGIFIAFITFIFSTPGGGRY